MSTRKGRLAIMGRRPDLMPRYGIDYVIHLGPGPDHNLHSTPYVGEHNGRHVIYWFGPDNSDFNHERGHVVDFRYMTDALRQKYMQLRGIPANHPWNWPEGADPMHWKGPDPTCERFADDYQKMQDHPEQHPHMVALIKEAMGR